MQEEVKRLNHFEQECTRKEEVIQNIREENADLQGRIRQLETSRGVIEVTGENDLVQKIMQLESELNLKRTEAASLKEQVSDPYYRQISNIRHTKSPNLNVFRLVLQLSLPNPLKPGVQSRMKM